MDQPVDRGNGDSLIRKDAAPGTEGLIGGDREALGLVAPGDEFEEHGVLGLIFLRVGDVVENDQVELVELRQSSLEGKVASGGTGRQRP